MGSNFFENLTTSDEYNKDNDVINPMEASNTTNATRIH